MMAHSLVGLVSTSGKITISLVPEHIKTILISLIGLEISFSPIRYAMSLIHVENYFDWILRFILG